MTREVVTKIGNIKVTTKITEAHFRIIKQLIYDDVINHTTNTTKK